MLLRMVYCWKIVNTQLCGQAIPGVSDNYMEGNQIFTMHKIGSEVVGFISVNCGKKEEVMIRSEHGTMLQTKGEWSDLKRKQVDQSHYMEHNNGNFLSMQALSLDFACQIRICWNCQG